jgi:hypothetical protein
MTSAFRGLKAPALLPIGLSKRLFFPAQDSPPAGQQFLLIVKNRAGTDLITACPNSTAFASGAALPSVTTPTSHRKASVHETV